MTDFGHFSPEKAEICPDLFKKREKMEQKNDE